MMPKNELPTFNFELPTSKSGRKRARTITTAEGRYVLLPDLRGMLMEEGWMNECVAMLAVGRQCGDAPAEIMRRAIGYFLGTAIGAVARMEESPKWEPPDYEI